MPPAYDDVLYAADPRRTSRPSAATPPAGCNIAIIPNGSGCAKRAKRVASRGWPKRCRPSAAASANISPANEPTRPFTLSAIIELVARSAIRPGSEQYAKLRGTRGAATLLKSNVTVYGETVKLRFRAKGAKQIDKEVHAPKLAAAIDVLRQLPGRRLFQYRSEAGDLRKASAQDVNLFLREIAGVEISLKDFRTLLASVSVLEALARAEPATSKRARNRQILDAICEAAAELGNTPAICRKSYVHETVVNAFEDGALERFAETLRASRSTARREQILAEVAAQIEDTSPPERALSRLHPAHLADELPFVGGHRLHRQAGVFHQRHVFELRLRLDRGERHRLRQRLDRAVVTATQGSPCLAVGSAKASRITSPMPTTCFSSPV